MKEIGGVLLILLGIALVAIGLALFGVVAGLWRVVEVFKPEPTPAPGAFGIKRRRERIDRVEPVVFTVPPELLAKVDREAWEEARRAVEGGA